MRAFADGRALEPRGDVRGARVRWPRPSRLLEPLELPAGKSPTALRTLGLTTVGELLEHLPRDTPRGAHGRALAPGEQATVLCQVRAIAARPVRRRGMRPLVEATVADATGSDARDVLQPAVAGRALPAGHAARAARQG